MDYDEPRSSIPPRRELLIEQYTLAHQAAAEEKEAATRFEVFAERSMDRKDYKAAAGAWEGACRATSNALRHRRAELELRKEEYSLYNHLDSEEKTFGLRLLIEYSERRLDRLRDDSYKATIKSRIAHLRGKRIQDRWDLKMIEQQIIEEDLHGRAKGHGGPLNDFRRQAPHLSSHMHLNDAAQKLRFLQGKIRWTERAMDRREEEIQQNEDEWERIREKERQREPRWRRLDQEAREYWSGERPARSAPQQRSVSPIPADEPQKEADEFDIAAAKIQREVEENARQEAEALRIQQLEDERMEEDANETWEDQYGVALEEDPAFTAPTQGVSMLKLDDGEGAPVAEGGDEFDALAASLLDEGVSAKDLSGTTAQVGEDSGSDHDASGSADETPADGTTKGAEAQVPV